MNWSLHSTVWGRSEPVDLTTKDHAFRTAVEALLPVTSGTIVARFSGDAADRTIPVVAYKPVFGAFTVVRKTGTTGGLVCYGVGREALGATWQPDHAKGLIAWYDLTDSNIDTVTPYVPCRAHGAVGGLSQVGGTATYGATAFGGTTPGIAIAGGGKLVTPINALGPMQSAIAGLRKAVLIVAAVQWDARTTNDVLFCWGNSVALHTSLMDLGLTTLQYRVRRVDTAGAAVNRDSAVNAPADADAHLLALLYRGRHVTLDNDDAIEVLREFDTPATESDRFVLGARYSAGAYSANSTFTLGGLSAYAGTPEYLAEIMPLAKAYHRAQSF